MSPLLSYFFNTKAFQANLASTYDENLQTKLRKPQYYCQGFKLLYWQSWKKFDTTICFLSVLLLYTFQQNASQFRVSINVSQFAMYFLEIMIHKACYLAKILIEHFFLFLKQQGEEWVKEQPWRLMYAAPPRFQS